jgi:hypothetical protein
MTIIGLTGKMGSGKDTVGALLIERGYKRLAFADALKATAYDINPIVGVRVTDDGIAFERLQDVVFDFGWEKAKRANPEVRRTLQALGVAARDNVKRSIWVDAALEVIDDEDENIVITDVRFPDEAQMVMHLACTPPRQRWTSTTFPPSTTRARSKTWPLSWQVLGYNGETTVH